MKYFLLLLAFSFNCYGMRVISTSPAISEMVTLLGAESFLVGVTPYCQDGKTATKIGTALELDYEKVMALKPDLIILQSNTVNKVNLELQKLKLKTAVVKIVTLDDLLNAWKTIASHLGKDLTPVKKLQEKIKTTKLAGKVLFVLGAVPKRSVMVAGSNTFFDDLAREVGLESIVQTNGWPNYDAEKMRSLSQQDVTVFHLASTPERLWSKEQWFEFCPKCNVVFSSDVRLTYPGPMMVEKLLTLMKESL